MSKPFLFLFLKAPKCVEIVENYKGDKSLDDINVTKYWKISLPISMLSKNIEYRILSNN